MRPRPPATQKKAPTRTPAPSPPAVVRRRVLLADDHPMMRAGMAQLINRQPDLEVSAEAGDSTAILSLLQPPLPDLLLTDMTMPGRAGIELIKDIRALHPELAILVVSMHDEGLYAERVLRAGARGYIMKEAGGEQLLVAIRRVLEGQSYVSERMSARFLEAMNGRRPRGSSSPIETLSDREFEVFQRIGQGQGTREIAEQLHLSPKTVEAHRGHIKDKLGLKNATALVRHAVRWVETQADAK